jgi:hypothetical protein
MNKNEKNGQLKQKKKEIDDEKTLYERKIKELGDYSELLNHRIKILRERFLLISEFLEESVQDIQDMDDKICTMDKGSNKFKIFNCIDLDSLSYKRKNYRIELEEYTSYLVESSVLEKELYENVVKLVK